MRRFAGMMVALVLASAYATAPAFAQLGGSGSGVTIGPGNSVGATVRAGPVRLRLRKGNRGSHMARHAAAGTASAAMAPASYAPTAYAPNGAPMDNAAVLALTKAGLGDPAILAKIRSSDADYQTGTDALLALRHDGVSSEVLAAMIEAQNAAGAAHLAPDSPDPAAAHPAGVYLLADWLPAPKMLAMRPIATARTKSGGILSYALTGGLSPVANRAVVPGPGAGHAGAGAAGAR